MELHGSSVLVFSFHAEKSAASLPDIALSDAHSCNPHFNFHLPPPTSQNCFTSHAWHRLVNRKVEQKIKRETERLMCPGGCCYLCLLSIPKVNDLVSCSSLGMCCLHASFSWSAGIALIRSQWLCDCIIFSLEIAPPAKTSVCFLLSFWKISPQD